MILVKSEKQTVDSSAQLRDGSPTVGLWPPRPPSELGEAEGLPSQSHMHSIFLSSGGLRASFMLVQGIACGGMAYKAPR